MQFLHAKAKREEEVAQREIQRAYRRNKIATALRGLAAAAAALHSAQEVVAQLNWDEFLSPREFELIAEGERAIRAQQVRLQAHLGEVLLKKFVDSLSVTVSLEPASGSQAAACESMSNLNVNGTPIPGRWSATISPGFISPGLPN